MKLTAEQARDLSDRNPGQSLDGLTVESNEQVDARRWVSVHQLVVKDANGKLWATTYERGLTEYQDIDPFEDLDSVNFHEVVKIAVTTYIYKGMGLAAE